MSTVPTQYFLGVDLGSTTAKAVVVDAGGAIVSRATVVMGAVSRRGMDQAVEEALAGARITRDQVSSTVSTGYGRRLVAGTERTFTEITCHARGTSAMVPGARLVIDIGGQDSKAIRVDDQGYVLDFAMNDRCASGTGRFFEVLAHAVEVPLEEVGPLALRGTQDLEISTMCATFAETEIISMLALEADIADIAASVHRAIAARTLALVAQVGRVTPIVLTGGVARNPAAVHFLSAALDTDVLVPADPQVTGAFGAALLARDGHLRSAALQPDVPHADHLFPHTARAGDHSCADCDGTLASSASAPTPLGMPARLRS